MRGSGVSYSGGSLVVSIPSGGVIQGSGASSTYTAYVQGIFRTTSGLVASPIWQQYGTFPNGNLDLVKFITVDPSTPGRSYLSFGSTGHMRYG